MDAVNIYEEAARKVGRGEINLMEFWKIIRPLRDVEVVRRGRWILCRPLGDGTPDGYMCSVCHVGGWEKTNFCQNCGAHMDGKDGESNESQN